MKHLRTALACILLLALSLLFSCANILSGAGVSGDRGKLTVQIAGTAGNAKTILPSGIAGLVKNYIVTLIRSGYSSMTVTVESLSGSTASFAEVPTGSWKVTVDAYDASGNLVALGSTPDATPASVTVAGPNSVTVNLAPNQNGGSGSVSITVTFPASAGVDSADALWDNADASSCLSAMSGVDGDASRFKVVFTKSSAASGSPLLRINLKKASVVVSPYSDRVWIFNNLPTIATVALSSTDFGQVPATPTDLVVSKPKRADAVTMDGTLKLSWTDTSKTEERYIVERSTDNWATVSVLDSNLVPNTTSYIDAGAPQNLTATLYRVHSNNRFGPSALLVGSGQFTTADYDGQVTADKAALEITYGFLHSVQETASGVTQNVTLPLGCGVNGSIVNWASDHDTVIAPTGANAGTVTMQAAVTTVQMTATIDKAGLSSAPQTKVFTLAVMNQDYLDVEATKSALAIAYAGVASPDFPVADTASSVTRNLVNLPIDTTPSYGTTVTWASSAIATVGVANPYSVVRGDNDATVHLTATIAKGIISDTKVFTLTVKKSDPKCVADDKAALAIGYAAMSNPDYPVADSASGVTRNVTLPATGSNDTAITWASDHANIISAAGLVVRPVVDTTVTLTATVKKHATSDTRTFSLTVLKSDEQCALDDLAASGITYAAADASNVADTASRVTRNIGLAPSSLNGSAVTWVSDTTPLISLSGATGTVTRQPASADTAVTITATAVRRQVTRTRAFALTVTRMTNAACVAADLATVGLTYNGATYLDPSVGAAITALASVHLNLTPLPVTTVSNSTVTWVWARTGGGVDGSVSAAGIVTRPTEANTVGTFTATVTKSAGDGAAATSTKAFPITLTYPSGPLAVTITLSDPSAASITFSGNSATMTKSSTWNVFTSNYAGATATHWYLDNALFGSPTGTGTSFTVNPSPMSYGLHRLTLRLSQGGVWYSGTLTFSVIQ